MRPVSREAVWVAAALLLGACGRPGDSVSPTTVANFGVTSTTAPTMTTVPPATATSPPTTLAGAIHERPLPLPGSTVVLRFDDSLAPGVIEAVEEALPVVRQDFGDSGRLAVHAYGNVDLFVAAHDPRAQAQARKDAEGGIVASTTTGEIWIYGPRFAERSLSSRRLTVFHEYFHAVQAFLSSSRTGALPIWLREGSARYFELRTGGDHGLVDFGGRRANEIRASRPVESLRSLETSGGATFRGDTGDAYTLGFVATEYLVNAAGVDAVKHDFWAALRPGTDWHIVFANVFGTSVDQFYADFEAYRRTL